MIIGGSQVASTGTDKYKPTDTNLVMQILAQSRVFFRSLRARHVVIHHSNDIRRA